MVLEWTGDLSHLLFHKNIPEFMWKKTEVVEKSDHMSVTEKRTFLLLWIYHETPRLVLTPMPRPTGLRG